MIIIIIIINFEIFSFSARVFFYFLSLLILRPSTSDGLGMPSKVKVAFTTLSTAVLAKECFAEVAG